MRLCEKQKIHLLSAEIYTLSVYDIPGEPKATKLESILSLDMDQYIDQKYIHVLYGMSKDTAAGGIRLGWYVFPESSEPVQYCDRNCEPYFESKDRVLTPGTLSKDVSYPNPLCL